MKRSRRHKIVLVNENMPKEQYLKHIKHVSKIHIDETLKSMGVNIKPKK